MAALALVVSTSLGGRIAEVDAILATLDALDYSEISIEERDALSAALIGAIAGTRRKVDDAAAALADFEARLAAGSAEIERLTLRAVWLNRQHELLSEYVLAVMAASQLKALEGDVSTLKARPNPVKVLIEDPGAVPAEFLRLPPQPPQPAAVPDKASIKEAIEHGASVAGARLARTYRLVRA